MRISDGISDVVPSDLFGLLAARFARVVWVPGNHELWTVASEGPDAARGVERYARLVAIARAHGVVTPEDPFPEWPGRLPEGVRRLLIVPLFLLYDYSFRPPEVALADVVPWGDERSEQRPGGKEGVSTCRFRLSPDN